MVNYELRKANEDDICLLFEWVNDEKVRKSAFSSETIEWGVHQKWFLSRLSSTQCDIYIFVVDEIPVGQVRLDYEGEMAYIDYSIAKEHRGNGYAKKMLQLLEKEVMREKKYIKYLQADVKIKNKDSRKQFERLGYEEEEIVRYRKKIKE